MALTLQADEQSFAEVQQACFAAGTLVLAKDGPRRIEDIKIGDEVLCKSDDDPLGPLLLRVVDRVFKHSPTALVNIHIGELVVRSTANHPFWVEGKSWTYAAKLAPGDRVIGHDNRLHAVTDLFDNGDVEPVFNFAVTEHHTYFVASADAVVSALVHNAYWWNNDWSDWANPFAWAAQAGNAFGEAMYPSWENLVAEEAAFVSELNTKFGTAHTRFSEFTSDERDKIEQSLGIHIDWDAASAVKQSTQAFKDRDGMLAASEGSLYVAAAADAAAGALAVGALAAAGTATESASAAVGSRLAAVLKEVANEYAAANPSTAAEALAVIGRATARLGLEAGVATVGANGAITLINVGGVVTTILANGEIIITRSGVLLLHLLPH